MAVADRWIITDAQLSDLKRFATDLVDGQLDSNEQASMGHNIESIIVTCESMPADDDPEDEDIEQEDEE